jgi:hypothetical protein
MNTIKKIIPTVCWLVAICILGFLTYKWSYFWGHLEYGEIKCCFIGNRLKDCMNLSISAVKEEFIYRFLPFLITTSIVVPIKSKKTKKIVAIISIIVIILIQLYFGYKHFHPEYGNTNYWFNVKLQGGVGILLACIYGMIFWLTMKKFYPNSKYHILIFAVCHIIALISAILVHSINNSLLVIAYTF